MEAVDGQTAVGVLGGDDDVGLRAEALDGGVDRGVLLTALDGPLVVGPGGRSGGESQSRDDGREAHGDSRAAFVVRLVCKVMRRW